MNINFVSCITSFNLFRKNVNSFKSNSNTIVNLSTLHKPILTRRNDFSSHNCKPICQYFGNDLKFKISDNNWPEIFYGFNTLSIRNKRNHLTVHSRKNPVLFKKLLNSFANIHPNNLPTRMIENITQAIRTRSTITIKIKNCIFYFKIIRAFNQQNILLKGNHLRDISTNKLFYTTSSMIIRMRLSIKIFIKIQNMILSLESSIAP